MPLSITQPMKGWGSANGSSTISFSAISFTAGTILSNMESMTISRRAAVQRWPAVVKADWMIVAAASSIFGVSSMTMGLLPPISSATILPGSVASLRLMAMPARAEPVNRTPSTIQCSTSP